MKQIQLTQGKVAIIDDDDFALVSKHKWYAKEDKESWYARTRINNKPVYMHRLILDAPRGKPVDHINRNGLDNRRSNIRLCTQSENQRNMRSRGGSSKFKGVSWHKRSNKWRAKCTLNGKSIHVGVFENEEDAARAYDSTVLNKFGEFAKTNKMLGLLD